MRQYERRLPQWEVIGQPLFVTFRLEGSLPADCVFPPATLTSGQAFAAIDRMLDRAQCGPAFLRQPEIARVVLEALADGEIRLRRFRLHAFVVMPNHMHLLLTPLVTARQWLGPLKGFTGYRANQLLGRRNLPFWQDESSNHLIRDEEEFQAAKHYVENNPVRAGLAALPEEFPWSSAGGGNCHIPERARRGARQEAGTLSMGLLPPQHPAVLENVEI